MSTTTRIAVLVAVFVVASLATGFAAALAIPANESTAFVFRVLSGAVHFGWAAGLAVAALFGLLHFRRKKGNAIPQESTARR